MSAPADPVAARSVGGSGPPRALTLLLGGAAAVIVVLGLRELAWLVGPVFLAFVIVTLVHPLHRWMRDRRVPEVVALLLLLAAIYGVVLLLVGTISLSIARLASILPDYSADATSLFADIADRLSALGIDRTRVQEITSTLDPGRLAGWMTTVLSSVISFGANVAFLMSLLLFLGIESTGVGTRLDRLRATRPRTAEALVEFTVNTRRYLGATLLVGLIVGTVDTVLLWGLGIPLAVLWGVLAVVCNFIPYVGFLISLVPPALLALLGGDWQQMLILVVVYVVLNALLTTLLPPYFIGDVVGLSMTVTLIVLIFWGWVLGPLGAILAIPLTLLARAVLVDPDPRADWAQAILGSARRLAAPDDPVPGRPARPFRRRRPA